MAAQPGAARVVFYDLARHRAAAERRVGQTVVVDFGTPGDAKYTLGGWNTRMRPGSAIDGSSVSFVSGSYGDVIVPTQGKGKQLLRLRVRAPRDGSLVAYVDDKVIAHLKSKPSEFALHDLALPADLPGGEHMLRLRASGIGRIGAHETAFALDWLSVGDTAPFSELPTFTEPSGALAIPAGSSLGYSFKVPPTARLTGTLAGQGARLSVQAVDDSLTPKPLAELTAGKVDIDLSPLAGQVVRLDLVARSELTLSSPRITVEGPTLGAPAAPIRNVLIYLIDTLRADHLKPFNPKTRVRAAGLDELVRKGSAVFTSAHTQENWTKPSVATLLSSLMPWEHGATTTEAVVPSAVQLLPERLSGLGFYSGAFIANGYVSDKFGFKQGWSTYRNYIREGRYSRAEFLAADVVEWLDKRPQDRPFMLYVHAIDPHVPYKPTAQFLSLYDPLPYDGVVDFKDDNELLEKIKIGSIKLKDRDKIHLEALYDSEISYHDLHFRTILGALDKRGLSDDTMVVVVADHGEEFWDHGSVGHGHSVYEELLRIPMVIRVPGVTSLPARVESSAGLVDIVPTVLRCARSAAAPGAQRSLSLARATWGTRRRSSGDRVGLHGWLAHRRDRRSEADPAHREAHHVARPGRGPTRAA